MVVASEEIQPRTPTTGGRKRKTHHETNPHDHQVSRLTRLGAVLASARNLSDRDRGNLSRLVSDYKELVDLSALDVYSTRLLASDPSTWGEGDRTRVLQLAKLGLTYVHDAQQLWTWNQSHHNGIHLRDQALVTWESNPSAGYKEMSRAPELASSDTIESLVNAIRIQGQCVPLSPQMFGTMYVYRPAPTTQWTPANLCTDWKSDLDTTPPEDPSPDPHLAPLPLPGGFADT
jgi:hypothetical protein